MEEHQQQQQQASSSLSWHKYFTLSDNTSKLESKEQGMQTKNECHDPAFKRRTTQNANGICNFNSKQIANGICVFSANLQS